MIVCVYYMTQNKFKNFLLNIKEQFFQKLAPHKTTLSSEEISLLLYKYTQQSPSILNDFLTKGTGKLNITWDDLLAYFQQQITVKDQVKKLDINPLSATQLIECYQNGFEKLIHHIKQKQTNSIQSIRSAPVQIAGKDIFIVCLEKQLIFYDYRNPHIIGNVVLKYSKVKQKIFLKQQQRRLKKQVESQKRQAEYLDKVQVLNMNQNEKRKQEYQRLLSGNLKESVRGSELSSQKSNDRKIFRKLQTDYGMPKRKQKSNTLKIKNDEVKKIFDIFCQTSVQNSIKVANIFKQSRQNFQKYVQIDKSLAQVEKKEVNFDYSSLALHRNFRNELTDMRNTNFKLIKMRKQIDNGQKRSKSLYDIQRGDESLKNKSKKMDYQQKNVNVLGIVTYHAFQNNLLVSLYNREIRLISLKKTITNFQYKTLFQKSFRDIVTYVEMYQNKKSGDYRIVLALEVNCKNSDQNKSKNTSQLDGKSTNILVYHLDLDKTINHKTFDHVFDFSARCESIKTYGIALFNQKGHFSLLQLNCFHSQIQEKINFDLVLSNPINNYKICITIVRYHKNLINLYLGCAAGYVYVFDRLCQRIKYNNRFNPIAILDMQLIKEDSQILALYSNGNIAILSANRLQKYFVFQSYHDIFDQSKLLIYGQNKFYLHTSRDVSAYEVIVNQEKKFNNFKPIKITNNREKLRNRSNLQTKKQKEKIIKVIEGKGGKGDFIALLYQNGEICLLDSELKYIGSYLYFNISNISDLICNEQYQFIAFLTEDNSIEVVNLYTQTVLFNLNFNIKLNDRERPIRSKTQSLKSSVVQRMKQKKPKSNQAVKCIQFMDSSSTSGIFFAIITQSNTVYHYSQKGQMLLSLNIQKCCNEQIKTDQLFYQKDQLLFPNNGAVTLLRRKSYIKKLVIQVCQNKLYKIKKVQDKYVNKILCLDQQCQIYEVDLISKTVRKLNSCSNRSSIDQIIFNQYYILFQQESAINLISIDSQKELSLKNKSDIYVHKLFKNTVIRINKLNGKIMKLNLKKQQFQQVFI